MPCCQCDELTGEECISGDEKCISPLLDKACKCQFEIARCWHSRFESATRVREPPFERLQLGLGVRIFRVQHHSDRRGG